MNISFGSVSLHIVILVEERGRGTLRSDPISNENTLVDLFLSCISLMSFLVLSRGTWRRFIFTSPQCIWNFSTAKKSKQQLHHHPIHHPFFFSLIPLLSFLIHPSSQYLPLLSTLTTPPPPPSTTITTFSFWISCSYFWLQQQFHVLNHIQLHCLYRCYPASKPLHPSRNFNT